MSLEEAHTQARAGAQITLSAHFDHSFVRVPGTGHGQSRRGSSGPAYSSTTKLEEERGCWERSVPGGTAQWGNRAKTLKAGFFAPLAVSKPDCQPIVRFVSSRSMNQTMMSIRGLARPIAYDWRT